MKQISNILIIVTMLISSTTAQTKDPYQWLEEVDAKKSLEFVEANNKTSYAILSKQKEYPEVYDKSLAIFNATDKIAYPSIYGAFVYNFWQDKTHVRGIWRRTTKASYLSGKPEWETLLDLDALSEKDGNKWVFKGASGLYPDYNLFLVSLSKGGGDAVIVKEFDATKKAFIKDGFELEEAKTNISYYDANTLIVGTDFGKGSMTSSGYPNEVKLWKRGTPLSAAQLIFKGNLTDVSSSGYIIREADQSYLFLTQGTSFYTSKSFVYKDNQLIPLDLPEDISFSAFLNQQLILKFKSDWIVNGNTYKQGSVWGIDLEKLIQGKKVLYPIYTPDEESSVEEINNTKTKLLLNIIHKVKSELYSYQFQDNKWIASKVDAPEYGTISINSTDEFSDQYFFNFQNFLIPPSLFYHDGTTNKSKAVQSLSAYFDASKYKVEQYSARSKDGTMIPYFIIASKTISYNGKQPTLLYGYGGFEVSLQPSYSGSMGNAWLEKGGVYVLSNIRGGGEFGPKWHQAGLKEKRQHIYNDFFAIAEDLIAKKITTPQHLGIMGGSNGGLLMGVAFTQRPELFNAVVCQVPLLDMQRYNKLLAGASWMAEYGNPDIPAEWNYIKKYSPYHNLKKGTKYPEVFFTTSTRDDRVHPGHARKMVAKMTGMGYKVYYYENTEGGHAGSSTNEQRAKSQALTYAYLWMKLK